MKKIIGMVGRAGSGKNTAADCLAPYGYRVVAFADALYKEVASAFRVSEEFLRSRPNKETPQLELALRECCNREFVSMLSILGDGEAAEEANKARSPREILQRWGTEFRLAQDHLYWVNQLRNVMETDGGKFAISDVRFLHEANALRQMDAILVRVRRASSDIKPATHDSERFVGSIIVDHDVYNPQNRQEQFCEDILSQVLGLQGFETACEVQP